MSLIEIKQREDMKRRDGERERDGKAMDERGNMAKKSPLHNAKQFAQTFLKFDMWCESTRGRSEKKVKVIGGEGQIANSEVGYSQ